MDAEKADQFDEQEAKQRLETALKGAFKTPPTPMKDIPPKRPQAQRDPNKKT